MASRRRRTSQTLNPNAHSGGTYHDEGKANRRANREPFFEHQPREGDRNQDGQLVDLHHNAPNAPRAKPYLPRQEGAII